MEGWNEELKKGRKGLCPRKLTSNFFLMRLSYILSVSACISYHPSNDDVLNFNVYIYMCVLLGG